MPIPHLRRRVGGGRHLLTRWAMFGTGLHRGGTGRRYLPGGAGWWGASLSLTRTFFGGGRVGQWRYRGSRTPQRWCVTVSVRRMRTSVATYLRWSTGSPIPGRFSRDLTGAMISCDGSFSVGIHCPRRYPSCARVLVVLVMLYVWHHSWCISDNIRRCTDAWDDLLLLIECLLIWVL